MDISQAAAPRADQINADDALSGPLALNIVEVRRGSDEQPVNIITEEFGPGRPWKPCKSMPSTPFSKNIGVGRETRSFKPKKCEKLRPARSLALVAGC